MKKSSVKKAGCSEDLNCTCIGILGFGVGTVGSSEMQPKYGCERCEVAGASIPPLSGGSQPPPTIPQSPLPPMVHVGDHGMIHALYLSQVGVSEREEMIKAPIILLRVQELKEVRWKSWTI